MSVSTGLQLMKRESSFEGLGSFESPVPFNSNTTGGFKPLVRISRVESSSRDAVSGSEDAKSVKARTEMIKVKAEKLVTNEEQQMLAPDSTTTQLEEKLSFNCDDDVFVKQKDGRYYLGMQIIVNCFDYQNVINKFICLKGTVIKSDQSSERWLVRFGDETERWATSQELRPLASPTSQEEKALCVVCKSRAGEAEVLTCNKCGRGYHRNCHHPKPSTTNGTFKRTLLFYYETII